MSKDPIIFIQDILNYIEKVEKYTKNINKNNFLEKDLIHNATIRCIEIIGEAASNIPKEIKNKYPEVVWSDMIGTRNILIHAYSGVNLDTIWDIAKKDLKILKKQMLKINKDLKKN